MSDRIVVIDYHDLITNHDNLAFDHRQMINRGGDQFCD